MRIQALIALRGPVAAIIAIAAAAVLAAGPVIAAEQMVAPAWPHDHSELAPDPALVWGRLANGFGYVLMANAFPRNRASLHLVVRAGSLNEADHEQGLAHFLEHMVFNGSDHFKPGELVAYLQRLGMGFGPDANAYTSFTHTVYDLMLPEADPGAVDQGLKIIDDYARGAWLLEEEIQRERAVVLAEKRTRDSADYRTFEACWNFKLPGTLVARRLPIGQTRTIEAIDRPTMKRFYDRWYRPDRMVLVVVGDVDLQRTSQQIAARFAGMQPRAAARPDPVPGTIGHNATKAFYHYETEAGQTTVGIEVIRHSALQPDSPQRRQTLLAEDAAHRLLQYRLDRIARQSDAPITRAEADAGIFLNWAAHAHLEAQCQPDKWPAALGLLEQTLRAALTLGFNAAEVDRVKREMAAELDDAVKQAATRQSPDLAGQIIAGLNRHEVLLSPAQEKALLGPMVAALDRDHLRQALNRVWAPDHRLVLVSGNAVIGATDALSAPGQILAVYNQSMARSIAVAVAGADQGFPFLPAPALAGRVIGEQAVADLGIHLIDFDNGTRLNLKPTDFKTDEVLVNLSFGKGRSAQPAGQAGLADLTEALVNESGVGPLDRSALEAALAGTSTSIALRVEEDRFVLAARTVKDRLALVFQLLQAYLKAPAWRPEAFDVVMNRWRQHYAELRTTADGALALEGRRFLAGGDERFGLPPEADMTARTLDQVKAWLEPLLASGPVEVSVVGDVDSDQVKALAARYIGGLTRDPAPGPPQNRPGPVFPRGQVRSIEVPTRIAKAMVVVAFATDDLWDIGRTRRLNLLADIFSEKLRDVIREKLGAAYSPYAFNRPGRAYPGHGLFQAVVTVAPDQAAMVREQVLAIAAELAAGPVAEDGLIRAREPSLTRIRDHLRENAYWLQTVLTGCREHPEQLAWARTILADYGAITAEQVGQLAGHYLKPENSAALLILPGRATATD